MYYLIDTTAATETSLGTVLRGCWSRQRAEAVQAGRHDSVIIVGLGRRWRIGGPALRADLDAWRAAHPQEAVC